ncbi:MAG: hypothetical protein ACXQS5_07365 [Candidatus Methanospirareceae archaeon]
MGISVLLCLLTLLTVIPAISHETSEELCDVYIKVVDESGNAVEGAWVHLGVSGEPGMQTETED